jgi:hypothetical protein
MRLRKQENHLTLIDINQYPVWEFALDEEAVEGQNEKTLRPFLSSTIDPAKAYLIVRASFYLHNGKSHKGFIKPLSLRSRRLSTHLIPYDLAPIIVTDDGQVVFCYGTSKPSKSLLKKNYSLLGVEPENAFPIKFSSDVEVVNSITSGTLEGFLFFSSRNINFFKATDSDVNFTK